MNRHIKSAGLFLLLPSKEGCLMDRPFLRALTSGIATTLFGGGKRAFDEGLNPANLCQYFLASLAGGDLSYHNDKYIYFP